MSGACLAKLAVLAILLVGCSALSGYPTNYQNTAAVLAADAPYLSADVRTNATAPNDQARGGLSQQQYRDTVVYRRIEVIDINYYDFESKPVGSYDGLALGTDLTALILNGFGGTTGGATAKAALAAASAGVIGANAAVNTDVFHKKTLPALVSQMRASRQTALVTIERGLTNPVLKYSLDQALVGPRRQRRRRWRRTTGVRRGYQSRYRHHRADPSVSTSQAETPVCVVECNSELSLSRDERPGSHQSFRGKGNPCGKAWRYDSN